MRRVCTAFSHHLTLAANFLVLLHSQWSTKKIEVDLRLGQLFASRHFFSLRVGLLNEARMRKDEWATHLAQSLPIEVSIFITNFITVCL